VTAALYEKLLNIDEQLKRPLFAVILADAYIERPDKVMRWDREDVLGYIYQKELEFLERVARDFGTNVKDLYGILPRILIKAPSPRQPKRDVKRILFPIQPVFGNHNGNRHLDMGKRPPESRQARLPSRFPVLDLNGQDVGFPVHH